MAKIKFSKTELKRQRDQLKQFTRFLPTLQLKKQQLQMELRRVREVRAELEREEAQFAREIAGWGAVFSLPGAQIIADSVRIERVVLETRNIAGVDVPVFHDVEFAVEAYDLFTTDAWLEDGIEAAQDRIKLHIRRLVLDRQEALLHEELRTTTQRVNLFEKVKIPEAKENIRVIQIYLGDQQTAAVCRSKIAKGKLAALEEASNS